MKISKTNTPKMPIYNYSCPECGKSYPSDRLRDVHISKVHNVKTAV